MKNWRIFAFADEASPMTDGQIAAMKRNGLEGLEIRNVDEVNVSQITVEKAREVQKKLEAQGLMVWSVGSPIGKIDIEKDDFKEHQETFKHTLEIANVLNAENLRLFSFYIPSGRNPEDYRNEVIDRLGSFCDIAKDSGICLCHENEKGIYGDTAERCLDILAALPKIKGTFDPANFVQCGQDTMEAWQLLHPYIKYLHIKDALPDGSVVPAGRGVGNVASIIASYQKQGGNVLTVEPHLSIFKGLSELERTGEESNICEYAYPDSDTAFDAACAALKEILEQRI